MTPASARATTATCVPPYLTREAVEWLVEKRIEHLVLDVPSLDRTHDEGHLVGSSAVLRTAGRQHRAWRRSTLARHHHRARVHSR